MNKNVSKSGRANAAQKEEARQQETSLYTGLVKRSKFTNTFY